MEDVVVDGVIRVDAARVVLRFGSGPLHSLGGVYDSWGYLIGVLVRSGSYNLGVYLWAPLLS